MVWALLGLLLLPGMVESQSANISVSIVFIPWTKINYPEGVYEPPAVGLPGTHRFTFNLSFNNFNAPAGSKIQCVVRRSDFSRIMIEKSITSPRNSTLEILSYTLQLSDPIDKHVPWQVEKCSLFDQNNKQIYMSNSSYNHPLNKLIYVHGNTWTRFDTADDDGYLASRCFLGEPKRYFNNTLYCDYIGDVAFSVAMSRGMTLEGECHDSVDNDGNGDMDCNDIYCQGITYTCLNHVFAGDPFNGVVRGNLAIETKILAARDLTYYYTRYIKPGGTLKVRIQGGNYATNKPVLFAITKVKGFATEGKYTAPNAAAPETVIKTQTSYALTDESGHYGNLDFVMYLTPQGVSPGWNTFSLYFVQYGQDLLIDGIPFFVGSDALSNWDESELMSGELSDIVPSPCFDGLDNDLNYKTDCQELKCEGKVGGRDCSGVTQAKCEYPTERTCNDCFDNDGNSKIDCADRSCDGKAGGKGCSGNTTYCEFALEKTCSDCFDNDRNGLGDCLDQACIGKSECPITPPVVNQTTCKEYVDGLCGPCPQAENYRWNTCLNSQDDNGNNRTDCADSTCLGEFGGLKNSPQCEATELSCGDGFDNDGNGLIDCKDPLCIGKTGPGGVVCAAKENTAALCTDNMDNDGNGLIDCIDRNCWGVTGSGCSSKFWGDSVSFEVPYMTPLTTATSNLRYAYMQRLHINENFQIRFKGTGSYNAVVITIGDATNPSAYFPFNASSCQLTGDAVLKWVAGAGGNVGQIQHKPSFMSMSHPLTTGFDVTLTCNGLPTPQSRTFPVSVTNLVDGSPDSAELSLTSTIYGTGNPTVGYYEIEPSSGDTVTVPYNSNFDIRAIPSADVNVISECRFNVSGNMYSTSSDCIFRYFGVTDYITIPVSVNLQDGSGNIGVPSALKLITTNIIPVATDFQLKKIFVSPQDNIPFTLSFITGTSGKFTGTCSMQFKDVQGSSLTSATVAGKVTANVINCDGEASAGTLKDGVYYVSATAQDDHMSLGVSDKRFFFVCSNFTSKGPGWDCSKADFDMDLIPDICLINGSVTTTTSSTSTTTTTIPEESDKCVIICKKYYFTDHHKCGNDTECYENDKWQWTYDGRGDLDCMSNNHLDKYCCCELEGLATTTTQPNEFILSCINGVQDNGEVGIDCGGPCPPCDTCYNGKPDSDEEAADCGGPCAKCVNDNGVLKPMIESQPRMYLLGIPVYVTVGRNVSFQVVDSKGAGLQSYLEFKMPNGTTVKAITDTRGMGQANSGILGLWSVDAKRSGYMGTSALWAALPQMTPVVVVVTTMSMLLPILALLLWLRWRRMRRGTAATEAAARALNSADMLLGYAPVTVTEDAYNNLSQVRELLKTVRLSDKEILKADKISRKYDIDSELGCLLVIAEKMKLAKILTDYEPRIRQHNLTKIVPVWEETSGKVSVSSQP